MMILRFKWLKRLVQEHPALQGVPEEIKNHLVEVPAANLIPLGQPTEEEVVEIEWNAGPCLFGGGFRVHFGKSIPRNRW